MRHDDHDDEYGRANSTPAHTSFGRFDTLPGYAVGGHLGRAHRAGARALLPVRDRVQRVRGADDPERHGGVAGVGVDLRAARARRRPAGPVEHRLDRCRRAARLLVGRRRRVAGDDGRLFDWLRARRPRVRHGAAVRRCGRASASRGAPAALWRLDDRDVPSRCPCSPKPA